MVEKSYPTKDPVSIEQAEAILAAVGPEKSTKMTIDAVAKKIDFWFVFWVCWRELDQPSRREAFKKLRSLEGYARKITTLLKSQPEATHLCEFLEKAANQCAIDFNYYRDLGLERTPEYSSDPEDSPSAREKDYGGDKALEKIASAVSYLASWAQEAQTIPAPAPSEMSPQHKLFGWIIPRCYKQIFGEDFGVSRSTDGVAIGPGIRFALAFLDATKIQRNDGKAYSSETIVRAFSDVKKQRRRRK